MFIHRIHEGEKPYLGLNWLSNEMTFLSFKLILPIKLFSAKEYHGFDQDNIFYGKRMKVINFRFRIRRKKNFPSGIKIFLFHCNSWFKPFGNQRIIATRETIEGQY